MAHGVLEYHSITNTTITSDFVTFAKGKKMSRPISQFLYKVKPYLHAPYTGFLRNIVTPYGTLLTRREKLTLPHQTSWTTSPQVDLWIPVSTRGIFLRMFLSIVTRRSQDSFLPFRMRVNVRIMLDPRSRKIILQSFPHLCRAPRRWFHDLHRLGRPPKGLASGAAQPSS